MVLMPKREEEAVADGEVSQKNKGIKRSLQDTVKKKRGNGWTRTTSKKQIQG